MRTVYPTVPPRVEYECTEMALELYETLLSLVGRAQRHSGGIARARPRTTPRTRTAGTRRPSPG